jgi:LPXTG-motif cell wall-anchored protein
VRRFAAVGALVACLLLAGASAAAAAGPAHLGQDGTATTEATIPGASPELPRTALEAEERDNGHTSQAPYLIWSGAASVLVVGGGGLLLKRRQDRETARERARAS